MGFGTVVAVFLICATIFWITVLCLLALPKSRMRSVAMESVKWATVAGLVLLIVSPVDLVPFIPVDDLLYIVGAIVAGRSAWNDRSERGLLDVLTARELRKQAGQE